MPARPTGSDINRYETRLDRGAVEWTVGAGHGMNRERVCTETPLTRSARGYGRLGRQPVPLESASSLNE